LIPQLASFKYHYFFTYNRLTTLAASANHSIGNRETRNHKSWLRQCLQSVKRWLTELHNSQTITVTHHNIKLDKTFSYSSTRDHTHSTQAQQPISGEALNVFLFVAVIGRNRVTWPTCRPNKIPCWFDHAHSGYSRKYEPVNSLLTLSLTIGLHFTVIQILVCDVNEWMMFLLTCDKKTN